MKSKIPSYENTIHDVTRKGYFSIGNANCTGKGSISPHKETHVRGRYCVVIDYAPFSHAAKQPAYQIEILNKIDREFKQFVLLYGKLFHLREGQL